MNFWISWLFWTANIAKSVNWFSVSSILELSFNWPRERSTLFGSSLRASSKGFTSIVESIEVTGTLGEKYFS